MAGARLSNIVWACSKWGHGLRREALAPLIAASVDGVAAEWEENRGRLGGVWLLKALARQVGGRAGDMGVSTGCAGVRVSVGGSAVPAWQLLRDVTCPRKPCARSAAWIQLAATSALCSQCCCSLAASLWLPPRPPPLQRWSNACCL